MEPYSDELFPFIIAGFLVSFVLAFGIGANDVANSFGTSVGSKVLTLKTACLLATVCEVSGAILLGYKVSDTVRKGIIDVNLYNNTEKELMLGSLAALGGSSIWNLVATFFSLPISGTHTIVGAIVGFSLCARGFEGVNWVTFGKIVASWFVSPLLSGVISAAIYFLVRRLILCKDEPLEPGLRSLPLFYGFTVLVNVFSIVHDGPEMLQFHMIPWWGAVIIAVGVGAIVTAVVHWIVVPRQRTSINILLKEQRRADVKFAFGSTDNSRAATPPKELAIIENGVITPTTYTFNSSKTANGYTPAGVGTSAPASDDGSDMTPSDMTPPSEHKRMLPLADAADNSLRIPGNMSQLPLVTPPDGSKTSSIGEGSPPAEDDPIEVRKLFSFLQIMTATFGSFAHGGNDVSNAIGPLIALWAIYTEGSVAQTNEPPIYILLYGGIGISVGLWVWGRRVMKTIGEDLTKVTPSSGFTIEIGAAFTVLLASKIGLPISTTHCKVGSVVFVGWTKSTKDGVDWSLFRNIVIAWIVTVPLTAGLSALLMLILRALFL